MTLLCVGRGEAGGGAQDIGGSEAFLKAQKVQIILP